MKAYKIKNTFPKSIAPIIDINGLPIKQTDESLKKRVVNFFKASFCSFNDTTFKTDEWKEYCDLLYEMVHDPKKLYGLVAIDGHHYDHSGSGDRGMVFNFGIPILRGRRKYKLDRIYVYMERRSSGKSLPHIRYWNSLCENDEEINFQWTKKIGAWHPHIQSGAPCLGRYETALADQWSNGYVVIYLRTINQFLNTWNRRSPYWDINHSPVDEELIYEDSKKTHKINFKYSKLINPVRDILGDARWTLTNTIREFIRNNFSRISSGSPVYDVHFLVHIWKSCDVLKHSSRVEKIIWDKLGEDMANELRRISDMARDGQDREYYDFSIFNKYCDGQLIKTRIPNNSCDGVLLEKINVDDGLRKYLLADELDEHRVKLDIVRSLSWFFQKTYMSIADGKVTENLVNNIHIEDYAIRLDVTYLNKLEHDCQELFDLLTKENPNSARVSWTSHESMDKRKAAMITKYHNRSTRVKRMLEAKVVKSIDKTSIKPYFSNLLEKYFHFTLYETEDVMGHGYMRQRGDFWPSMNISTNQNVRFKLVEKYMPKFPETLEECLIVYSKLKQDVLILENKVLLGCHKKIIRRLEKTNVQINNTEENRRQVPLFFE